MAISYTISKDVAHGGAEEREPGPFGITAMTTKRPPHNSALHGKMAPSARSYRRQKRTFASSVALHKYTGLAGLPPGRSPDRRALTDAKNS